MDSGNVIWFAGTLGFLVGALAGVIATLLLAPSRQKNRDMEKHLSEKQNELKNYQHEVTEHFTQTAELLGDLAKGYRDVHNHLAMGAQELCKESFDNSPILASLPSSDDPGGAGQQLPTRPPLDYAPKSTPYEQGTLNEEYGLEKVASSEPEPASPTPDAILGDNK